MTNENQNNQRPNTPKKTEEPKANQKKPDEHRYPNEKDPKTSPNKMNKDDHSLNHKHS